MAIETPADDVPEVSLALVSPEDVEQVQALLTPQVCHGLVISPVQSMDDALAFIRGENSAQQWRFSICHPQYGVIGGTSFTLAPSAQAFDHPDQMTAVFSYWLGQDYQGKGYASTAVQLLLKALREQGIKRFLAQVRPANIASQKLLARLGFHCDATAGHDSGDGVILQDFVRND